MYSPFMLAVWFKLAVYNNHINHRFNKKAFNAAPSVNCLVF